MNPESEVYASENGEPGGLNEIFNGQVSEQEENSKGMYNVILVHAFFFILIILPHLFIFWVREQLYSVLCGNSWNTGRPNSGATWNYYTIYWINN